MTLINDILDLSLIHIFPEILTLKEFAEAIHIPANDIIKKLLISGGGLVNLNTELDFERAEAVSYTHLDVYKRQLWKQ